MFVYTTRAIEPGAELRVRYLDIGLPFSERSERLGRCRGGGGTIEEPGRWSRAWICLLWFRACLWFRAWICLCRVPCKGDVI